MNKPLRCPLCSFRVIEIADNVHAEVRIMSKEIGEEWQPDFVSKCQGCKSQIGIKKNNIH